MSYTLNAAKDFIVFLQGYDGEKIELDANFNGLYDYEEFSYRWNAEIGGGQVFPWLSSPAPGVARASVTLSPGTNRFSVTCTHGDSGQAITTRLFEFQVVGTTDTL